MSDPVTNVEIEDVLSSIRRLVSDGDKAKSSDQAPSGAPHDAAAKMLDMQSAASQTAIPESTIPEPPPQSAQSTTQQASQTDRLVLTPAFLVVDDEDQLHDADTIEDTSAEDVNEADTSHEEPLKLTEMVWEKVEEAEETSGVAEPSDRSDLVATIAELEAAISAGGDDYEPDGSEAMAETIPWPGAVARNIHEAEDAELTEDDTAPEMDIEAEGGEACFENRDPETDMAQDEADADIDVYADDDLDGLLDVGGVSLDEEALRELVADVVRQELSGDLGEKITRNVRKLVRREIYRILSSQEFD